jgi:hypothetical protein
LVSDCGKLRSTYWEDDVKAISPGPVERQVRAAPIRTMGFNHLGQRSFFLGLGVDGVLAAERFTGGGFDPTVLGGLYAGALVGLVYGVRGYNASTRGLATNRITSIVGMVLALVYLLGRAVILR